MILSVVAVTVAVMEDTATAITVAEVTATLKSNNVVSSYGGRADHKHARVDGATCLLGPGNDVSYN